jgi:two-component system, OmpR family, response regulator
VRQITKLATAVWSRSKPRVLVVDDDRDTVQTLGILFRSEGMDVRMLQASEEVVPLAEEFFPEVVLLDIGMPGRNGFEVAEDLRKRFGRNRPVIVAVTAYSGIADKCRARASGFDHYCVKPYDPVALLQLVTKIGEGLSP